MMNQEDIFKKIGQILNELSDQYQYLAQNPQELNELELELFLANASFLSDHVQIIKKINSQAAQKALSQHNPVKEENHPQQPEIPAYKVIGEPEYTHEETPSANVQPVVQLQEEDLVQQPAIPVEQASGKDAYMQSAVPAQKEDEPLTPLDHVSTGQEYAHEAVSADEVKAKTEDHEHTEHTPFTVEKEPEHTYSWEPEHEVVHTTPRLEDDIFKPDIEPATFEFILNEKPSSDRFEFEEKSVDEIFDRPLSKEEELIIAQKQKLREMDSLELQPAEEDEIGPEPFLVADHTEEEEAHPSATPIFEAPENEFPGAEGHEVEETEPEFTRSEVPERELPKDEEPIVAAAPVTEPVPAPKQEPVSFTPPAPVAAPAAAPTPAPVTQPTSRPIVQEELFRPVVSVASVQREEEPMTQPLPKPTLNDILSGNTPNRNFNTDSRRAPITDLKQAISLNDKMRYIKDLFNGYNLAYAEAIDLLNKMPDFKTADAFLKNNYAGKHNWADKQETADQFYELLNMRFPLK